MISASPARPLARGASCAAALCCLGLALSAGCKKHEQVQIVRQRGIGDTLGAGPAPSVTPTPTTEPARTEPTTYDFERGIPTDPSALTVANAAPSPSAMEDAGAQQRDLGAELSRAITGATSCADVAKVAAQPGGRLTISVTATLLATGSLSRVEVRAPGQPDSALRCVEQLAAGIQLGADAPGAPVRVTGSTEMRAQAVQGGGGTTGANAGAAPAPAPTNPNIAVSEKNADIARPEPADFARPEPPDLAGPP